MTRTLKRELAVLGLAFWAALTCRLFWGASPELIGALSTAYGTASTSIWLFAAAAFGIDSYVKQVMQRGTGASQ
jgi:hypothetical protein